MHFLYCDESNIDERQGDFLLYGGLMIPSDRAAELSASVEQLRLDAGIDRQFDLKFNPKPESMEHIAFRNLKQSLIEVAIAHDVKMLAYAILHDISSNPDEARRFGINTVCYHFDCCLEREKTSGIVLLDRFNDNGNIIDGHLTEKFAVGLTDMPYAREYRLSNILGFHYTAIGQSHFTSLIDIAIGSLRYAMNVHTRGIEAQKSSALRIMSILSPLFLRHRDTDTVSEFGFMFSPKIVKVARYREIYQSMKDFFGEAGVVIGQSITNERQY